MGDILGDPEAVSWVGRKGSTKVFKDGRQSPGVPTLTGLALIEHKKCFVLLCPIGEQHLLGFFFVSSYTTRYRFDHSLSVSCTKEMHTKTKTKDAFPVTCVAWWFCREQSPRGFAALARLSYFALRTKTAMLLRLLFQKYKLELTTGIHAHSHENVA